MDQNKNHTEFTYRQFGLSNWALNNRKVVMVLTFIIFFWGVYTYITVPKESFPEIVVPTIYVGTPYPGNSGEDIEKLITRPLEKEINIISLVKSRRYFHMALRSLLSHQERMNLKTMS